MDDKKKMEEIPKVEFDFDGWKKEMDGWILRQQFQAVFTRALAAIGVVLSLAAIGYSIVSNTPRWTSTLSSLF